MELTPVQLFTIVMATIAITLSCAVLYLTRKR